MYLMTLLKSMCDVRIVGAKNVQNVIALTCNYHAQCYRYIFFQPLVISSDIAYTAATTFNT